MNTSQFIGRSIHVFTFLAGTMVLSKEGTEPSRAVALAVIATACLLLVHQWQRKPEAFGQEPAIVAQLLVHAFTICIAALAIFLLDQFWARSLAILSIAAMCAIGAALLSIGRAADSTRPPWNYARYALASVCAMSVLAVVIFHLAR